MISVRQTGNFDNLERFLKRDRDAEIKKVMERYGETGIASLAAATPVKSGETASSWYYKISGSDGAYTISWHNSHMAGNVPLAILIQYGHATGNGGYVQGRDFINPAIRPILDEIARDSWREITKR